MYNNRQNGAENRTKESLASNQVVGGSNPSGCAKFIEHLAHFRKFESSNIFLNFKVVIDSCGAIVGSVYVSSSTPDSLYAFKSRGFSGEIGVVEITGRRDVGLLSD